MPCRFEAGLGASPPHPINCVVNRQQWVSLPSFSHYPSQGLGAYTSLDQLPKAGPSGYKTTHHPRPFLWHAMKEQPKESEIGIGVKILDNEQRCYSYYEATPSSGNFMINTQPETQPIATTVPETQPIATTIPDIADECGLYSGGSHRRFRPLYTTHVPSLFKLYPSRWGEGPR